ncbi:hypothetical protein U4T99_12545 [Klebsiella pneumoniae]
MRDLILQLSKSSIYSTKPPEVENFLFGQGFIKVRKIDDGSWIGILTLTYEFIVKYMALIHKTEIPESWLTDNGTSLDERRVLYMEASDILTKDIVREIRKTVKSPQDQLQVYRINDQIITLEMMEK